MGEKGGARRMGRMGRRRGGASDVGVEEKGEHTQPSASVMLPSKQIN